MYFIKSLIRWFNFTTRIEVPRRKFKPLYEGVQWILNHDEIQKQLRLQYNTTSKVNFQFVARLHPDISKKVN